MTALVPIESIEKKILMIRGYKVMLDSDLAELYGVETKTLNRAVNRNRDRFPADFMFPLNNQEVAILRYQIGTSSEWGGKRYFPNVFTEYGVVMLSSVLKSKKAIHVNIEIMRTFGRLRQMLGAHKDLARKLEQLEKRYDSQFSEVFAAIRQLMAPPKNPKKRIGFDLP